LANQRRADLTPRAVLCVALLLWRVWHSIQFQPGAAPGRGVPPPPYSVTSIRCG